MSGFRAGATQDAVHPNQAGYDVMGPLAEKAIEQALQGR
jgi:lysophospholipase L1-like esterase